MKTRRNLFLKYKEVGLIILILIISIFSVSRVLKTKTMNSQRSLYGSPENRGTRTDAVATELVENYIKENFDSLVPERVPLNGKWEFVSIKVDPTKNNGTFEYRYRNATGVAFFQYKTTPNNMLSFGVVKIK